MKTGVHTWLITVALLGAIATAEAATMIFQDPITNYPVGSQYVADNPAVIKSQDNGGNIGVFTNLGAWASQPGDEFVNIGSGSLGNYTTLAVPANVSDRYGQIFVRVGKNPANTEWMRLIMSTNASPSISFADTGVNGAGADFLWDPNGLFRYMSGASQVTSSAY